MNLAREAARIVRRARLGRSAQPALGQPSALVVPVPEADQVLSSLGREQLQPGMPYHVTVLYPFAPPAELSGAEPELVSLLGSRASFPFRLVKVERFPGVLYLEPEPSGPFVELTTAVWGRWPRFPPYGGRFPTVVPHLTVAEGGEPPGLATALAARLPMAATASAVWLMVEEEGGWSRRLDVPLRLIRGP